MAMIKVTQTGSPIRRPAHQRQTLIGLGLNKIGRSVEIEDSSDNMGAIRKVAHMLKVETA